MELKKCSRCTIEKSLNDFYKDGRYSGGYTKWCKQCKRAYCKEWGEQNALRPRSVYVKTCNTCRETKAYHEFSSAKEKKDGLSSRCKECRLKIERPRTETLRKYNNHLWSKYRIRLEQFNEMLEKQDGKCAICEAAMTKPVVDHCHSTGRIRGILCAKCNRHMAAIDESGFMEKAMRYINAL